MSLNKAQLIGRLGQAPELKYTPSGTAVCNFSLATSEKFTGKDGQKQERTEWHRIVVFSKLAELCGQYLSKGRQIYIEGRLQTRSWDKDGQKHYTTEIVADKVIFLGGDSTSKTSAEPENKQENAESGFGGFSADDIPF
jgi:single-strand DNA-binding protein